MITKLGFIYVPTKIDNIEIDKINGISISVVPTCEPISFTYDLAKVIAKQYIDSDFALECMFVECKLINGELVATSFEWASEEDLQEPSIEIVTREEECDE